MIGKIFTIGSVFVFINVFASKIERDKILISENRDIIFPDEREPMGYHHDHHHYHHSPSFHHHHNYGNPENSYGQENSPKTTLSTPKNEDLENSKEIPLQLIQEINRANLTEVLRNYIQDDEDVQLENRFGSEAGSERDAAVMPKLAGCQPELQTVNLVPVADLSTFYYPTCTRVERCGGCCSHALLSCQPQETEILNFRIIKSKYTGGNKLSAMGKEVIQVEKHTKCKCDCIVQAKDCNPYQEYRKNECKCACKNRDEEKKCLKSSSSKLWNNKRCACECRTTTSCSTGTEFDQNECRCKRITMRRRYADYPEKNSYQIGEAPAVVPFENDK